MGDEQDLDDPSSLSSDSQSKIPCIQISSTDPEERSSPISENHVKLKPIHGLEISTCITELLVQNSEFITTGVPLDVLEAEVTQYLNVPADEAKALINKELEAENIVKLATGNIYYGPRKSSKEKQELPDAEATATTQSTNENIDEDEEEDDSLDEVPLQDRFDREYQPSGRPRKHFNSIQHKERSARPRKSKYDSSEYVLTGIKKRPRSRSVKPATPPVKPPKPVKKVEKPAPKRKSNSVETTPVKEGTFSCFYCKYVKTQAWASTMIICRSPNCQNRAHRSCIIKSKGAAVVTQWQCSECFGGAECVVCRRPSSRALVNCSSCGDMYHRLCHTPPISHRGPTSTGWRCTWCPEIKPVAKTYSKNPGNEERDEDREIEDGSHDGVLLEKPKLEPCVSVQSTTDEVTDEDFRWSVSLEPKSSVVVQRMSLSEESDMEKSVSSSPIQHPGQPPLPPIPDPDVPDVTTWTPLDVSSYFKRYFNTKVSEAFLEQDIDGCALKLMGRMDVFKVFKPKKISLGITLKVLLHVKRLQLKATDRRYIWAAA